ncbi:MAG: glucosyl transferase, partial [Ignavibacterium sp.]|nr:glucosyl transferase [Ignavibacterium sp.]MDW8375465.1 glucosyl transferase [Ignavibacteriales bacterium]
LKDGNVARNISLSSADTLLYVDSLLPNKSYRFDVALVTPTSPQPTTNHIQVKTMDTTSHNFTWQSWTFGECGNSALYDVAIIDENNIWAVGEIYMRDSLGRCDPNAYNAIHWNGQKWELKRIPLLICGSNSFIYTAIYTVFAFSDDNIFFSDGAEIIHYNGISFKQDCSINPLLTGKINKLWGSSSNDLYAVGNNGNIAHWDGVRWRKIESGTTLNIYDIWGDYINDNNKHEINLVAAEHLVGPERKILTIKNNSVAELSTSNMPIGSLYGIWFKSGKKYYVAGNGIYVKNNILYANNWTPLHNGLTPYYIYSIRGSRYNDISLCGSFGELLHFNGNTWKTFRDTPGFYNTEFIRIAIKESIITSVGYSGSQAFLTLGKR